MSEVGVIGQIYEDRRTKKQGKLIERDDKYKTLLLESTDGKSFNVSYGGFKSNWRSVSEPVETLEEAMQEVEIPEKPEVIKSEPKSEPVKKEKKKQVERSISEGYESASLLILDYAKSFHNPNITSDVEPNKRSVSVKVGNVRMFLIVYKVRTKLYQVYSDETLLMQIKDKGYISSINHHENWPRFKYTYLIGADKLDEFIEDARQYIIDYINY